MFINHINQILYMLMYNYILCIRGLNLRACKRTGILSYALTERGPAL